MKVGKPERFDSSEVFGRHYERCFVSPRQLMKTSKVNRLITDHRRSLLWRSAGKLARCWMSSGMLWALLLGAPWLQAADVQEEPWRLQSALGLPDWFQLSGSFRTRFESLDGQFRTANADTNDQLLVFRTLLKAEASFEHWGLVTEFQDSRQEKADTGSTLSTTSVNTTEFLQAYLKLQLDDLLADGANAELRLGRQTMDAGSRRLVARNRFRNTLNAFDGVVGFWESPTGPAVQAFYLLPVVRRPSALNPLLDNDHLEDRSYSDFQFWGVHSTWTDVLGGNTGELYFFGLNESDDGDLSTRDRRLYTPGLRLYRKAVKGTWDFDVEWVGQFGEQRNSTNAADTADSDHWAQFAHLESGWTQDLAWQPRVAVLFDYASGDEDPNDGESNRFDTLFGARRFDHGPTGIYGAFARTNIVSPGLSLKMKPSKTVQTQLVYRAYWLASDTDAWSTSGLRDVSGQTDPFVGQQIEGRLSWDLLPGNLSADVGAAYLFAGPFIEDAPNANGQGDSLYGYGGLSLKF